MPLANTRRRAWFEAKPLLNFNQNIHILVRQDRKELQ